MHSKKFLEEINEVTEVTLSVRQREVKKEIQSIREALSDRDWQNPDCEVEVRRLKTLMSEHQHLQRLKIIAPGSVRELASVQLF